jgi:hypothetical protein
LRGPCGCDASHVTPVRSYRCPGERWAVGSGRIPLPTSQPQAVNHLDIDHYYSVRSIRLRLQKLYFTCCTPCSFVVRCPPFHRPSLPQPPSCDLGGLGRDPPRRPVPKKTLTNASPLAGHQSLGSYRQLAVTLGRAILISQFSSVPGCLGIRIDLANLTSRVLQPGPVTARAPRRFPMCS